MDYNEISWDAVGSAPSKRKLILTVSGTLSCVLIAIIAITYMFSRTQSLIPPLGVVGAVTVPALSVLAVVGVVWYKARQRAPRPVVSYKLNEQGILINSELHQKWSEVNAEGVKKLIQEVGLPYEEWKQNQVSDTQLKLDINGTTTTSTLLFNQEYDRQRVLRSIAEHLSIT